MGHGLGLGQIIFTLRERLFRPFLLGDVDKDRQTLLPRVRHHRLDADMQGLTLAGRELQPAGFLDMTGKDHAGSH